MNEKIKDIIEWIVCILVAIILALLIKYYIGTPTLVQQESMVPTLQPNDRLILNRIARTTKTMPNRGDIITLEAPVETNEINSEFEVEEIKTLEGKDALALYNVSTKGTFANFVYNVLEYTKISYIKRVIGLPGDHVQIKDEKVYINGEVLTEDYLDSSVKTTSLGGKYIDLIVPENAVFVMGDNRAHSKDSRYFGCIPLEKIESKVVIRFWPINKFGKI